MQSSNLKISTSTHKSSSTKKPTRLSLVLGACTLALGIQSAQAEISGNVALTNDYVWRGMTQTDNEPAIQGGFDYGHESGVYLGTWGSNVDFGGTADLELDIYGGYATELGNGISLDVGAIRYMYPDSDTANWNEFYLGAGYMGGSASINYSGDVYGSDETGIYYTLGYEHALPQGISLSAGLGYYDIDQTDADSLDWKLGVAGSVQGVGLELAYFDLDHDTDSLDDDGVMFTLSKSL